MYVRWPILLPWPVKFPPSGALEPNGTSAEPNQNHHLLPRNYVRYAPVPVDTIPQNTSNDNAISLIVMFTILLVLSLLSAVAYCILRRRERRLKLAREAVQDSMTGPTVASARLENEAEEGWSSAENPVYSVYPAPTRPPAFHYDDTGRLAAVSYSSRTPLYFGADGTAYYGWRHFYPSRPAGQEGFPGSLGGWSVPPPAYSK